MNNSITNRPFEKKKYIIDVIIIVAILILEILFFRHVLPVDNLIGDNIDARLNTVFLEHWNRFFQGKESITDVCGMFYPAENVLSYSDIMLGYGIIHTICRVFGVGMYVPLKIMIIGVHIFGSYSLYYLMRRCLKKSSIASFLAVIVFSFSIYYGYSSSNVQLFSFSMMPFILIMIYKWYENRDNNKRIINMTVGLLLYVLQFYTAFYVAYFSSLCLGILLVVAIVYNCVADKEFIRQIKKYIIEFVIYIVSVVALLIPFVIVYLPTSKESNGRKWEEVYWTLPDILDFFKIGERSKEFAFMPYWLMLVILLILVVVYIVKCVIAKKANHKINILIVALVILFLLFDRCGEISLWWVAYSFVPGANAIRALFRAQIIVYLLYAFLFGFLIDEITEIKPVIGIIVGLVISICFSCSCIYYYSVPSSWTISEEKVLDDVGSPPDDCKVMFIMEPKEQGESPLETQLDATVIAIKNDIKTINGYSGLTPKNWNIDYSDGKLKQSVKEWCDYSRIDKSTVYGYSFSTDTWFRLE